MESEQKHLYEIQDELTDTWLEDWAGEGIEEIEEYLAKHAAFLAYYEGRERQKRQSPDVSVV